MTVRKTLMCLGAGMLILGALIAAPVAQAAIRHTVSANVPKPQAACGNIGTLPQGAWLANKSCGYVVGTALAGTTFDNNKNSSSDFHFGRTYQSGGANFCAWILPSSFTSAAQTVADSCSDTTSATIVHRKYIGRDFDNEPHEGNGAPTIPINASGCTGYYNYFDSSTYSSGYLRDPVGYTLPTTGAYRYSTKDSQAAMIRVGSGTGPPPEGTTWMFVARSCIAAQLVGYPLSNTND